MRPSATAGFSKVEEFENLQNEIKKTDKAMEDQLTKLSAAVAKKVEEYKSAGGQQEKIKELADASAELVSQITTEPNKTYVSTQERLVALLDNLAQLTTTLVLDNEELRSNLGNVDKINSEQIKVQIDELKKVKDELEAEAKRHEGERTKLITTNDELSTKNAQLASDAAGLKELLAQAKNQYEVDRKDLNNKVKMYRDQIERRDENGSLDNVVMDVPAGKVTFVDYNRGEVQTNLTRSQGVTERLHFAVFDRNSPGLPTDHPKGTIEVMQVGNSGSLARILKTNVPSEPIRANDKLYSPAFGQEWHKRFALIGKIDVNRDSKDDREDLKRMIQAAGGEIDYDLPPPGIGKESGNITALTTWYVIDDEGAMRPETHLKETDDTKYLAKQTEMIQKAEQYGVRHMRLKTLLAQLGYQFGESVPGQVEAIDKTLSEELSHPKSRATTKAAVPPTEGRASGRRNHAPGTGQSVRARERGRARRGTRAGEVRGYPGSLVLAPKGRPRVARGVSPWKRDRDRAIRLRSPAGATEAVAPLRLLSPLRGCGGAP